MIRRSKLPHACIIPSPPGGYPEQKRDRHSSPKPALFYSVPNPTLFSIALLNLSLKISLELYIGNKSRP